jgi:hypothetical protein
VPGGPGLVALEDPEGGNGIPDIDGEQHNTSVLTLSF